MIQRDTLRQELANTPAMLVVEAGSTGLNAAGQPISPAKTRVQEAEDQLKMLLLRDTAAPGRDRAEEADRGAEGFAGWCRTGGRSRRQGGQCRDEQPQRGPVGAQSGLRAAQGQAGRCGYQRQFAAAAARRRSPICCSAWRRCSASSQACWPNTRTWTATTACCAGTMRSCWAGCSQRISRRRRTRRRTRSSCRSSIRLKCRDCRPRRTGCCWCPASSSRGSAAALRCPFCLGSSTAHSPRSTTCETSASRCSAAFPSWVGRQSSNA